MSNLFTLVPDIYQLVNKKDGWFSPELSAAFSEDVSRRMSVHFNKKDRPCLRLSQMGLKCPRALWYSIHKPELAEPLPPQAMIKYSYGHIIEALIICLARASGHEVTGEQDELRVDDVVGHRDCVIDGCLLDVKSCSDNTFQKLKKGTIRNDDSFGYLEQLDGYLCGSQQDPLVRVKDRAYILGIDKVLGNMVLYEHEYRDAHIRERIASHKKIVAFDTPPKCECGSRPFGESGNLELDVRASYSAYKWSCMPHLRAFRYAKTIKYLTRVIKKPDVPEVDKYGHPIG